MDWKAIVDQLGWHDVLSKWKDTEPVVWKEHADADRFECSFYDNFSNPFHKTYSNVNEPKVDAVAAQTTKIDTNPFHNPGPDDEDKDGAVSMIIPPLAEGWFYRDPQNKEHGPFNAVQMSSWFDVGYFDQSVQVRRAGETQYVTIAELTKSTAAMFSSMPDSNLIPSDYIDRVISMINPFMLINKSLPTAIGNVEDNANVADDGTQYKGESYSFNISRKLKDMNLKDRQNIAATSTSNMTTPIKFNIGGIGQKQSQIDAEEKENRELAPSPNRTSLLMKFDKLQKYWLDVAQSKLTGPKHADRIQVELFGKFRDALLESDSRVSCLGAGAIGFIHGHNLTVTPLKSVQRFIKNERGANIRIYGHLSVSIKYKNRKFDDFKLLVVPDLDHFLYLGADFSFAFKLEKKCVSPIDNTPHISRGNKDSFFHILDMGQNKKMNDVVQTFPCITKLGLGVADAEAHKIEITKNIEFFQNHVVRLVADTSNVKVVNWLLEKDVIEMQPHVPKYSIATAYNQGELEIAIMSHLKKINAVIKDDQYPLTTKPEILNLIKTAQYISSIDLGQINWQIPLAEESRKFTAFEISGCGRYQFKRLPSGIKNIPQRLHRLMHGIFSTELSFHYAIVSNELLIFSANFVEHMNHLGEVARKFAEFGIRVNAARSSFCQSKVKCLGYVVGSDSRKVDPEAWKCITSITLPTTKGQLHNFLQLADWFRAFIMRYDKAVAPLVLLANIKADSYQLEFSGDTFEAFSYIKRQLTNNYELPGPDYSRPFHVQCHVSFEMIAGVLYQEDDDVVMTKRPVAYCVSELSKQQQDYSVTELECLALVTVLRRFHPYLDNEHFKVYSDKQIINWVMEQTELASRLSVWCLQLHAYNFTLHKRPSVTARDSSNPLTILGNKHLKYHVMDELTDQTKPHLDYELFREQIGDHPNIYPDFKILNDLIYCRRVFDVTVRIGTVEKVWKLYIPAKLRTPLIERLHVDFFGVHRSPNETLKCLREEFYWSSMSADVQIVAKNCMKCNEQ